MKVLMFIVCLTGYGVLGQRRIPGLFRDEDLDSFSVTLHPKSQKVVEGSPLLYTCISSLEVPTEFKWRLGSTLLASDSTGGYESEEIGVYVVQTADNISVLRIDKGEIKRHRKKLTCEVKTEYGLSGKAQSSIKIFRQGRARKGFPAIQTYPESPIVYRSSEKLTLTCTSGVVPESRDVIEWRWIKNGTWDLELYEGMEERLKISESGTLEIFRVEESDAGTYECVAENRRGSSYSPIFEVIVEQKTASSQRPCENHKFQPVPHGSIYQPYPDPCMECECEDGEARDCAMITCDEPPCQNYVLTGESCCAFRCLEEETVEVRTSEGYGACVPYLGPSCREFIQGRNVFLRPQESQQSIENKLRLLFRGAENLSEDCMEYMLPFLCFHTVPLCDNEADKPRGRHVCREDCEIVADMCQDEFIVFRAQYINGTAVLPKCEQLPGRNADQNCISFEGFLEKGSVEDDRMPANNVPSRRNPQSEGAQCVDRYGKLVNDGDLFLPEQDPCLACICDDGARIMCTVVACEPPPCRNYERLDDSCCGYVCKEEEMEENSLGAICKAHDGSDIEAGEQFQPTPDPCYQCFCRFGEPGDCRTISCDEPEDCPNPKAVPGLCCAYTCDERRVVDPDFVRKHAEPCIANNGTYITNGDYQPGSDPCTTCRCVNGRKEVCASVGCIPPDCPNPVPVPGVCCKFICKYTHRSEDSEEEDRGLPSERCLAYNGSYVLNGRYNPGADLCTTCDCINGKKGFCMSVGCVPPPCPNRVKVPGTCCEFRCEEPVVKNRLDPASTKEEGCLAHNGSYVLNGRYNPEADLCKTCECINGKKGFCMSVGCVPPLCPNRVKVPGTCCEFRCEEPGMKNRLDRASTKEGCLAYNGSYVLNGRYNPEADLCKTCECINGKKGFCMSVGCVPPPCPNRVKVPGTCCEFRCEELNMMVKGNLKSPRAPSTLSVQQVGSRGAIIHWKLDQGWNRQTDPVLTLLYNCTMNSTITNITLPTDLTYIVLSDLHLHEQYHFSLLSGHPEDSMLLDMITFRLKGRGGQSLYLGDVSHGDVYESRGGDVDLFSEIRNRDSVYIMFNSFHRIDLKLTKSQPCGLERGCHVIQFSLFNNDGYLLPVLALLFEDERDFNWAHAHL